TVDVAARSGAAGQAGLFLGMTPDWSSAASYVGLNPDGGIEIWSLQGGWTQVSGPIATGQDSTVARTVRARLTNGSLDVWVGPNSSSLTQYLTGFSIASDSSGTYAGLFANTLDDPQSLWPKYDNFTVQ